MQSKLPVAASVEGHPSWFRLQDQLSWYDGKSQSCQRNYKRLKLSQVTLAVLIPLAALLPAEYAKWATSVAGALIALLEAIQQMNQYSTLWVTYRGTAESLKHEQYLFLGSAGPYRGMAEPDALVLLAERVEEHVSTEHGKWVTKIQPPSSTGEGKSQKASE